MDLRFLTDGRLRVTALSSVAEVYQWTSTEEREIVLGAPTGCDQVAASYLWTLDGDVLTLSVDTPDSCPNRRQTFVGEQGAKSPKSFTKVPGSDGL